MSRKLQSEDYKFHYFATCALDRRAKIISIIKEYNSNAMTDEKKRELFRRYSKNENWYNFCIKRRLELAGLFVLFEKIM